MSFHPWDVSSSQAINIQEDLSKRVVKTGGPEKVSNVCGVDVSFPSKSTARAAAVVLSFPHMGVVEKAVSEVPVSFPYIPGLLAFREGEAVLSAVERLKTKPDLFLFDAQGLAHPRRLGLASHIGVLLNKSSIGIAKSRLVGSYQDLGSRIGDKSPLIDNGEVVGTVVRTKPGSAPIFISIGHKISLEEAVRLTLVCTLRGQRLPRPTLLAHNLCSGLKV
ncbi:endonuclease V [Candidatus Saccharibacteria bacterium]|nr:endonuclease V [Candidatus Saccharibacteria bacterium]